jgi:hypothetical protein
MPPISFHFDALVATNSTERSLMLAWISCPAQLITLSQQLLLDSRDILPKDEGSVVDESAPDDYELGPECCLFVANLPQDLCNGQLACALFEAFRAMFGAAYTGPPGALRSIKVSRDSRMKPFGFVVVDSAGTAKARLECTRRLPIRMSGRRLRIELAKRQHRLKIRVLLEESANVVCEQAKIYQELCTAVSPRDIRVLPLRPGHDRVHPAYVVKLDRPNEELVLLWASRGWQVQRMPDSSFLSDNGSFSTRNSGLVHLVIPENWQDSLGSRASSSSTHRQPTHGCFHHHRPLPRLPLRPQVRRLLKSSIWRHPASRLLLTDPRLATCTAGSSTTALQSASMES